MVEPKIFEQHPDLKIGAIVIKSLSNTKRVSVVEGLLRGICAQRSKEFKDKEIYDQSMIDFWSRAYGNFGINPKKYPPSIAALLKRVKSGKEVPHISALVDLYNYFSLKHLLPIGGEDLDWLCGDLKLAYTRGGESFRPIGSIEVEKASEGEIAYMDNGGITCRFWNYRECERTKFTNKTTNAVILVEDLSHMHLDEFGSILQDLQNNIIKYIGGQIEPYILNSENISIDLGIQGRISADDSRVPQQEKAHFFEQKSKQEAGKIKKNEAQIVKKKTPAPPAEKMNQASQLSSKSSEDHKKVNLEDDNLMKSKIRNLLEKALEKNFPEVSPDNIYLQYPASAEHGDYASNMALHLSKELKQSPQEIAKKIIENFPKSPLIAKVELAGPGFMNFFLSEKALQAEISQILKEKSRYGSSSVGKNKTVVLDYSAPNIAKPLGVHHLLSTIIGQSICNIYKKLGFNTISINHIGDWGTQFGKLIYAYKQWGNREIVGQDTINELLKLYVKFHDEAEKNAALDEAARYEFKKFEDGDEENRRLWQWFVDESLKEIEKTYEKLGGIHFDYVFGESFYENKMAPILEDGKEKGVIVKGEEGAYVVHFDDPNISTVPIQKKDGATLYLTRDLATLKYRLDHFKPEKIIYIVDIAQTLHFKQIFATAKRLGWYHNEAFHAWFGRMHMKDGKMSTRKGTVILLDEVLDEAVKGAAQVLEEKNPDLKNKEKVAEVVGIGAVKYNILSQNRTTDITFDWNAMLSLEGNSAPYLQYSYARAKSILKKGKVEGTLKDPIETEDKINALIRLFPKFTEQIALAAAEYKPNVVSNYLYELAQRFNSFYNTVPVLKAEHPEDSQRRLEIVEATAQILKNGLNLLGVDVVEEM